MNSEEKIIRRKKLIEVSIPLEGINKASAREKTIRHGHPSTFHLWWARRPLASARAVLFCQLVDDPSSLPEEFPSKEDQNKERERLFFLIDELVQWKNSNNKSVIDQAKNEIKKSWLRCCSDNINHPRASVLFNPEKIPSFHDPFAGGGTLPLEAQRLGLKSYASDLNPVAVIINKALLEIPTRFHGLKPINKDFETNKISQTKSFKGAQGIANDVKYYGDLVNKIALEKIGHLYPSIRITNEMLFQREDLVPFEGKELKTIAWIWARTVKSPNPSFSDIEVPLVTTFYLSRRKNREAFIEPIVENNNYSFKVRTGLIDDDSSIKNGTKIARGANFKCLLSGSIIDDKYIKTESMAGRINKKLMAIVVEGPNGRIYLDPTKEQEEIILKASPKWSPDSPMNRKTSNLVSGRGYGFFNWSDLFDKRQLVSLNTFIEIIGNLKSEIEKDAIAAGLENDNKGLDEGGFGAKAYSEAINIFLSIGLQKCSDYWNSFCSWTPKGEFITHLFTRQAIAMVWDYAEANPFSKASGNWIGMLSWTVRVLEQLSFNCEGVVEQLDAQEQTLSRNKIISTDPPYYDNIAYADLSDFFYVWLQKSLKDIYPRLFATISAPKEEELIAAPYRHGGKEKAEIFFLNGMTNAIKNMSQQAHKAFPITIFYAFKQTEKKASEGTASTGWETFLNAIIEAGLSIVGTWPMRTEMSTRMVGLGTNALASSVILVCQTKDISSRILTRNEFRNSLRNSLPKMIKELESSNIAPVDLAQAAIGPGMSIYSQAKDVLKPDDSKMNVREALIEINSVLDEYLTQSEYNFDSDTAFALTFFESFGYSERPFGDAEGLAKARNIGVEGIVKAGILKAVGGRAQIIRRENLQENWDPYKDDRLCAWEATQYLIKKLEVEGESAASELLNKLKLMPGQINLASNCRSIAYRLYNHCEKTKQLEEARSYNGLIIAWPELERLAAINKKESTIQTKLL